MTKSTSSELAIWSALVSVYLIWGSTYFAIRVAIESMPPLLMTGARFLLAGVVLLAFRLAALGTNAIRPTTHDWRSAAIVGAALILGGNGGTAFAERSVPSGMTALIAATVPLWIAAFDRLYFRRLLSAQQVAGLAIGFGAVGLLVGRSELSGLDPLGASVAVLSAIAWAAGSLYARGAAITTDPSIAMGMEMLVGGTLLMFTGAGIGEFRHPWLLHPTALSWLAFAYLVIFGSLAAFSAYLWLLRVAPIARVSSYAYVNPFIAVLLGAFALHESIGAYTIAAGAAILTAVALIAWESPSSRAQRANVTKK